MDDLFEAKLNLLFDSLLSNPIREYGNCFLAQAFRWLLKRVVQQGPK
jgi:hypothetical protein